MNKRRQHNDYRFLGMMMFLAAGLSVLILLYRIPENEILSPVAALPSISAVPVIPSPTVTANKRNLSSVIEGEIGNADMDIAVTVKNLKTGESYYRNEHERYDTASLYKLFVMLTVFDLLKKGELEETDIYSENAMTLNTIYGISSESAEISEGLVRHSVANALDLMITRSDNYAAMLFTRKLTLKKISETMEEYGFSESRMGSYDTMPYTTAFDMQKFFEKLYTGRLVDPASDRAMLALLKRQEINTKIPSLLGEGIAVAHKTGELGAYSHDAGIIYGRDDILLAVLTKSSNQKKANELIARIAERVYDYYN